MANFEGSIEIVGGHRVGRPVAVYVAAGSEVARHDFRTRGAAVTAARKAAEVTGWLVREDLNSRHPRCTDAAAPGGTPRSKELHAKACRILARAAR